MTQNAGEWPCETCGEPTVIQDVCVTLVGHYSPVGHDHDDNCLTAIYKCAQGHFTHIAHRRKCPVEGCDWVGKLTCFCHKGEKVGVWVNDEPEECRHFRFVQREEESPAGIAFRVKVCAECGERI